jgi:hypothetical protein
MILTTIAAGLVLTAPLIERPLLLDGRCDVTEWRGAAELDVGGGVRLLARQDREYVYLCLRLPPSSLGTLDLWLETQPGAAPVNLHISAQVGERTKGPQGWPEWRFGNQQGWYGPPVAFSGMDRAPDGGRQGRFADSAARELQLSKARFGAGPWRARLEVRALGPDREGAVIYPAASGEDSPDGWLMLDLSDG